MTRKHLTMSRTPLRWRTLIAAVVLVAMTPGHASAYIGPGAGFALAGSFLAVFGAMFSAVAIVVSWPVRRLLRMLFRKKPPEEPRFKRVVVLGLDGLDYQLTEALLKAPDAEQGKLAEQVSIHSQ